MTNQLILSDKMRVRKNDTTALVMIRLYSNPPPLLCPPQRA